MAREAGALLVAREAGAVLVAREAGAVLVAAAEQAVLVAAAEQAALVAAALGRTDDRPRRAQSITAKPPEGDANSQGLATSDYLLVTSARDALRQPPKPPAQPEKGYDYELGMTARRRSFLGRSGYARLLPPRSIGLNQLGRL